MRTALIVLTFSMLGIITRAQEFSELELDNKITDVQPMTGIVLWNTSSYLAEASDAISLEYSYMHFNDVINDSGTYNWDKVESKLNDIASRGHQAIFRFRYVYPGQKTTIPQYILDRDDYTELIAKSEGKDTYFADWTCSELKRFTLEFYTRFARQYDNDPRLAFIQVGFGLWSEYHIYSGPNKIGEQFPDKKFQESFFYHLDTTFKETPWNISIDAANSYYSPFEEKPELKNIKFGLFDDSFMHQNHGGYNTDCWNFFDRERYKNAPVGGEFSYYNYPYDQQYALELPDGPYGISYEEYAKDFHISYIIGSHVPTRQPMERIKEAGRYSGYNFKVVKAKTTNDSSVFTIKNNGVAPIYYDAYIAVNAIRSSQSLKYLLPGDSIECSVSEGAEDADIGIECDRLVSGQEIQFEGTQDIPNTTKILDITDGHKSYSLYPNPVQRGVEMVLQIQDHEGIVKYSIYNCIGGLEQSKSKNQQSVNINTNSLNPGIYFIKIELDNKAFIDKILIL